MAFTVSQLYETDVEAVDAVVMAAYNVSQSRKASIRLYLDLQPDGAYVVRDSEMLVGFGAALDYGSFAYVGLMSVHPSAQKRGVGRLLLERLLTWLDERHCPTVLLDATPVGAPLYEQYGFVEDDKTVVLRRTSEAPRLEISYSRNALLQSEDTQLLTAFDAPLFGAERARLLSRYLQPERTFVIRDRHKQVSGYLVAQPHSLGPWIARTGEDAEQLLRHALTRSFESAPSVFVSARHADALALLRRYDFMFQRDLKHMYRGKRIERRRQTAIYGQVSLGLG